jgi:hypothetical protein
MSIGNVRQWLEQSDIDYFTHFVKAWIPFNAWYRHEYETTDSEHDILERVKTDNNRMRKRIMAQLAADGADAEQLRNHIASLHRRLSTDPLEDRQKRRIAFDSVCVGRNSTTSVSLKRYGSVYAVERNSQPKKQVVCTITNKAGGIITITHAGGWDVDSLTQLLEFQQLPANKRGALLACYKDVDPYVFRSLLAESSERSPIDMDGYRFVNDCSAIFAGLVDVLYGMRNLLFHGELVPDPAANRTYEPGYHLLRHFLAAIA